MKTTLTIVLVVMGLLVAGSPAVAQESPEAPPLDDLLDRWERLSEEERAEKLRLYDERLQGMPEAERARLLDLWETKLRGLSPEDRKDLAERLGRVKERANLEELKRKREQMQGIEERTLSALPPGARNKVERLPRDERESLMRFSFGRLLRLTNNEMLAELSEPDRETVSRLRGHRWYRTMKGLLLVKDLEALPVEERARIAALSGDERKAAEDEVYERASEGRRIRAQRILAAEMVVILELPPLERKRRIAEEIASQLLFRLGVVDREVIARLRGLPPKAFARELKTIEKLAAMRPSESRTRLLTEFLRTLGQ